MSLEITGKITQKLALQSGRSAKGEWSKQEFVLEVPDGNYTSNAVFNVWGADKVKELEKYNVGDSVKISFSISSREFNGRWYTDLRAWRIQPEGGQDAAAPRGSAARNDRMNDMPAGFAPQRQAPAPTMDDFSEDGSDDLPF